MTVAKRTALVTGASAGLGIEFAHPLAAKGCEPRPAARRAERPKEVEALERGRLIHVSGRLYRMLDPFAQSVGMRLLLKALAPGR